MPLRSVVIPTLGRSLACLMGGPSSSQPATHQAGLDAYRRLGGDGLYLHGEGGETHSRLAAGEWLHERRVRDGFFVCTQICHDEWDEALSRPIDRFTSEAVAEDVARDRHLIALERLDLVMLGDRPGSLVGPVIEALAREVDAGRVGGYALKSWPSERISLARDHAHRVGAPGPAAVFTTELSLPRATAPMWTAYHPFELAVERIVRHSGMATFAWVHDINLGQCLFGDEDPIARMRPEWVTRWQHPANAALVERVREFGAARGLTTREVGLAWVLSRPFPVVGIVGLPELLEPRRAEYERAAAVVLTEAEGDWLRGSDRKPA